MINLRHLGVEFRDSLRHERALASISLSFSKGERVAVLGLSGSGKSTLVKAIANQLPKHAKIEGDLDLANDATLHLISQNPYEAFHPTRSLRWHLTETIRYIPASRLQSDSVNNKLLKKFLPDAEQLIDRYPYEVSGGQLMRFNLALAAIRRPDILLADEPTASLDFETSQDIAKLLKEVSMLTGCTLIIATHDLAVSNVIAETGVWLRSGQLERQGEIGEISNAYAESWNLKAIRSISQPKSSDDVLFARFRGVSMGYARRRHTLTEMNFDLSSHSLVLIVGKTGSGKSTLIRSLFDSRIFLNGDFSFPITSNPRKRLAGRNLGVVFQDSWSTLSPHFTIQKILEETLNEKDKIQGRKIVAEFLDMAGLERSNLDKFPHQLSGGQRQRVAILRAFIGKPRLVLLDEPTSHLDPVSTNQVLALLSEVQDGETSFMVSSHKPGDFRELSKTYFRVESGKVQRLNNFPG